jgi:hypothetical protein
VGAEQIIDGSVTSAEIANGSVTSADIAANTITGADIAFDSISSALIVDSSIFEQDIANEAGVAFFQQGPTGPIDNTHNTVLLAQITTPSAGFIVATASVELAINGLDSTATCSVTLNSPLVASSAAITYTGRLGDFPETYSMFLTRGFNVSGPGVQNLRLICSGSGGDAISVGPKQLTAIFAPTGY